MPKYIDLLEQRTALKATKEQMFKLGYQKKDLDDITQHLPINLSNELSKH